MRPEADQAVIVPDLLPRSEPPTLATRGPSGGQIKREVIRALAEQHGAIKQCYTALDELIARLQSRSRRQANARDH